MCKGLGVGTWGHHGVFEARTDPGRRPVSPAAKEAPRGLSRQQGPGFGREPTRCRRSSPHRQTPRLLGPLPPGLSFQGETKRPRAEGPLPGRCPPGKILCGRLHEGLRDLGGGGLDGVTNSSRQVSCSISQTPDSAPPGGCRRPHPPSRARSLRRRRWRRSGLRCGAPAWETGRSVI